MLIRLTAAIFIWYFFGRYFPLGWEFRVCFEFYYHSSDWFSFLVVINGISSQRGREIRHKNGMVREVAWGKTGSQNKRILGVIVSWQWPGFSVVWAHFRLYFRDGNIGSAWWNRQFQKCLAVLCSHPDKILSEKDETSVVSVVAQCHGRIGDSQRR